MAEPWSAPCYLSLRQNRPHLKDRYHRQEANEEDKSNIRKSPIDPMNIDQSNLVPEYIAHDEGRKSRCRLVTMIT